ncbi:MAG: hypothetical protein ACFE7R_06255 [Candidatus Hodarchaeota archaeon]
MMKRKDDDIRIHRLEKLEKKGMKIEVPIMSKEDWRATVLADPLIPRTYSQLRRMGKMIYDRKMRKQFLPFERRFPIQGVLYPWWQECLETVYSTFNIGLQNPFLNANQRNAIESDMDSDMPPFENTRDTTHFTLHWTDNSADAADNIDDENIIVETGDHLETAWDKYDATFGRTPYIIPGNAKIDVYFYDLANAIGGTFPTSGIDFDSSWWVNTPGVRQPCSAHELFHRLQYTFGFRTTHAAAGNYQWFTEGTASWSEVFVWSRVSLDYKMHTIFNTPDYNLLTSSYRALPFWIFFDTRQRDDPDDIPLVRMLEEYEIDGDIVRAANDTIIDDWPPNNVYNQLDSIFALFARERRKGNWEQTPTGGHPYAHILDSDGNDINPVLQVLDVDLSFGDTYSVSTSVNPLGSDYYHFILNTNTAGKTISVDVDGSAYGDFSFYTIWEKDGVFKMARFPSVGPTDYAFSETIDLDYANAMILIVSGRMSGGGYSLSASIF